ncbi:energy transducer TonB family protein [Azospirillum canadense]|uniref:energy transducer TonB family protein n=1 Tax=Azospirillum canadense TaxID=403962 RepID=UPI002227684E|nr:energy transducer TonB [Azospirillum canadense]MCW2237959.1 protein TonB [Azospirillum canadense]
MAWMVRRWAPGLSVSAHAAVLAGLMASHGLPPPAPPVLRIEVSLPPIEEARAVEAEPLPEPPVVPEVSEPVVPPPMAAEVPPVEPPTDPEPPVPEVPPPPAPDPTPPPAVPTAAVLVPLPPPKPQRPVPPKPSAVVHRPPPATVPRDAAPAAASSPPASAAPGPAAPPAPARVAGPPPDYLAAIQARLARYKVYPRAAQLAREQGTVLLRFAVARDGRVLSWTIERGSGVASLDRQVETMIERAAPLPPIPEGIAADRLDIVLPVQFALQ